MDRRIRFKGRDDLYLIGGDLEEGGAIATKEQFESGAMSYAHLCEDGIVRRFNQEIGTREDIEFTGEEVDLLPTDPVGWMVNVLSDIVNPPRGEH